MKTAVIGAGPGCQAVLELFEQGKLRFLNLDIFAVVDMNPDAPGIRFAQQRGWTTPGSVKEALALPGLELVIELTGRDEVLERIYRHVPPGVRVMDHVMARVFWDLGDMAENLFRELQEKTELQAKVDRDRAQLQDILDAVPDVVMVLDQEMRIVRVNEGFERLTGKLRDKVRGMPLREAFTRADVEDWSEDLAELFEEVTTFGRPVTVIRSNLTGAGKEIHFQIAANPLFDQDLKITRVVETAREITEQVTLKRETEESARRFQQIIDAVHGIVTIKDLEGRYQVVNPWTEQIVGLNRDEMIGKTASELFSQEAADLLQKLDQETLAKGSRHVSEEVFDVGGKERILVSERLPLTDYKGDVVAICCVSQDQTRQPTRRRCRPRAEQPPERDPHLRGGPAAGGGRRRAGPQGLRGHRRRDAALPADRPRPAGVLAPEVPRPPLDPAQRHRLAHPDHGGAPGLVSQHRVRRRSAGRPAGDSRRSAQDPAGPAESRDQRAGLDEIVRRDLPSERGRRRGLGEDFRGRHGLRHPGRPDR
jgi:PAS domain S-box-containing protein